MPFGKRSKAPPSSVAARTDDVTPGASLAPSFWDAIPILPRRNPPAASGEGSQQVSILNRLATLLTSGGASPAPAANADGNGMESGVEAPPQAAGETTGALDRVDLPSTEAIALPAAASDPGAPDVATPDAEAPAGAASGIEPLPPLPPPVETDPFAAAPEAVSAIPDETVDSVLSPPGSADAAEGPGDSRAEHAGSGYAPDEGHDVNPPDGPSPEPPEFPGGSSAEPAGEDQGAVAGVVAEAASDGGHAVAPAAPPGDAADEDPVGDLKARQFLSYLVHPAAHRASATSVAAACRAFGDAGLDVEPLPLAEAFGDRALALTVNGQPIIAMTIDAPLPQDAPLLGEPQAVAAARAGAAHTVLALIEPVDGQPEALEGAAAMTIVLSAMAMALPAEAVVFGASGVCATAKALNAGARDLVHGQAPARLWFDVRLHEAAPDTDGRPRVAAASTGLAPFIGMEIEFAPAAMGDREMRRRIFALAAHLAVNGFAMSGGVADMAAATPAITAEFRNRGDLVLGPALVLSLGDKAQPDG